MAMLTRKTLIPLVVVLAVLVAVFVYYFVFPGRPVTPTPSETGEIVPPPATGEVDDVVDALLKELSDEEPLLTEEEGDTSLVTGDSQEVSNFGQTINEDEL